MIYICILVNNFEEINETEIIKTTYYSFIEYTVEQVYPDCALKCFQQIQGCNGFAFNNDTKRCQILAGPLTNALWVSYCNSSISYKICMHYVFLTSARNNKPAKK